MLTLEDYGTIFLLVSFLGALLISSPALAFILPPRTGEQFSELYVLGPNRMAEDYPFNVKENETYRLYLGVGNHMKSSAYYLIYVKLRDRTEALPNITAGTPSPLPALHQYRFFLEDGKVWERPINFSLQGLSFHNGICYLRGLIFDGREIPANKQITSDSEINGYPMELFFELWIYDPESHSFTFHKRFVGIWLNMTIQD